MLDMGTGTGFIAFAARNVREVIGVDIDKESIDHANERNESDNIKFYESDLFSNVSGKFDLITFNPPYLPPSEYDDGIDTTDHGIIERFLYQAKNYLKKNGKILIVFSSLSNFKRDNSYRWEKLDEISVGFEKLFVYELSLKS